MILFDNQLPMIIQCQQQILIYNIYERYNTKALENAFKDRDNLIKEQE